MSEDVIRTWGSGCDFGNRAQDFGAAGRLRCAIAADGKHHGKCDFPALPGTDVWPGLGNEKARRLCRGATMPRW